MSNVTTAATPDDDRPDPIWSPAPNTTGEPVGKTEAAHIRAALREAFCVAGHGGKLAVLPWPINTVVKDFRERAALWAAYRPLHQVCPKCGSGVEQKTIGVHSPPDRRNGASCRCGWQGVVDDLVPGETK